MDGTEEMRHWGRRRYPSSWKSPQKVLTKCRFAAVQQDPLLPLESLRVLQPPSAQEAPSVLETAQILALRFTGFPGRGEVSVLAAKTFVPGQKRWHGVWSWHSRKASSGGAGCGEETACFVKQHYPSIPFRAHPGGTGPFTGLVASSNRLNSVLYN